MSEQANNCYEFDKCTCLDKVIVCQKFFGESFVTVPAPERIERFYLSNSFITALNFIDSFPNLEVMDIYTDVIINCSLVYSKESCTDVHIDVSQCSGV